MTGPPFRHPSGSCSSDYSGSHHFERLHHGTDLWQVERPQVRRHSLILLTDLLWLPFADRPRMLLYSFLSILELLSDPEFRSCLNPYFPIHCLIRGLTKTQGLLPCS